MSFLIDKAAFAAEIHAKTLTLVNGPDGHVCGMNLLHVLGGMITETVFLFEEPDTAYAEILRRLGRDLGCEPGYGKTILNDLPPASIVDQATEKGRALARSLFEEWLHCIYEFHDILNFVLHHILIEMEQTGAGRAYSYAVLQACADKCLAFELSAQELCDLVIERKIGDEGWTLTQSVSGLSAVAGRFLGLNRETRQVPPGQNRKTRQPEDFDDLTHVMTQEAIRLGIPAGSDWRMGLAANDYPVNAPFDLIFSLIPDCKQFFDSIGLTDDLDRAVGCAKAAGRMLAVAAGGERPEIEPVVAKPLAMAALTDTYKSVCALEEETAHI